MSIARLHAFRRILLSLVQAADPRQMRALLTLLRMTEEDLLARGALRERATPQAFARHDRIDSAE